jgi:Putative DNA-binding domain
VSASTVASLQAAALALEQAAFVAALRQHGTNPLTANSTALDWLAEQATGVAIYHNNARMLSPQALAVAFPVLQQLLGEDNFSGLARSFWRDCPPSGGDLGQWGEALPRYMAQGRVAEQLVDEPYLPDVARVEWAVHQCARAADAVANPQSLALLMQHDPAHLRLVLSPGWVVVQSPYPVASLVNAHAVDAPEHALQTVGQSLRQGVAETALIYRQGFKPQVRQAVAGEPAFLQALATGLDLSAALDALPELAPLDFAAWLTLAVQTGLLVGVTRIDDGAT